MTSFGPRTKLQGNVRAKSGSITRVRCYAGYLSDSSGKHYAFALMSNNYLASPKTTMVDLLQAVVSN